jgi:DNA-binding response OmpR family regulator
MTHVLLIDDDELITRPLAAALEQSSYRVTVAHTGQHGLELALAEKPDVVILDVLMPAMDGWQVCQALRRHSTVPF